MKHEELASNRMNKLKLRVQTEALSMDILWCRVTSAANEIWNSKRHSHSFYELHLALRGTTDFQLSDNLCRLAVNSFCLLPPHTEHARVAASPEYREFVLGFSILPQEEHVDGRYVRSSLSALATPYRYPAAPAMTAYIQAFLQDISADRPGLCSIGASYLTLLLFDLLRQINPGYREAFSSQTQLGAEALIQHLTTYITDSLEQGLTSEATAAQFHMSVRQLNRLLAEQSGLTLRQIIDAARLDKIRELLRSTALPLDPIAEQTGFSNAYNMSRFFKRMEGMSPGQYRASFHK